MAGWLGVIEFGASMDCWPPIWPPCEVCFTFQNKQQHSFVAESRSWQQRPTVRRLARVRVRVNHDFDDSRDAMRAAMNREPSRRITFALCRAIGPLCLGRLSDCLVAGATRQLSLHHPRASTRSGGSSSSGNIHPACKSAPSELIAPSARRHPSENEQQLRVGGKKLR